jgi:hypothetical protein
MQKINRQITEPMSQRIKQTMKQRINESRNEPTEPTKKGNPFNESLNQ